MSYDNSKRRWQVRRLTTVSYGQTNVWEDIFTGPVFLGKALSWIIWARFAAPRPPEALMLVNMQSGESEYISVWRWRFP